MDFPRTDKKIKYTIVGQITIDAGDDPKEVNTVLQALRDIGEAEVVDVEVVEPESDEDA